MKNFKPIAQTLPGAHFVFCPPKIGFFRGGGVQEFFSSSVESCDLGAHTNI